jgi:CubicO group peptidase (beta-lactamase class C family)
MKNVPFRVLFREFLFRMVDLELLAPKGDISKLLGQFAALLIFVSAAFGLPALFMGSTEGLTGQIALMLTLSIEHFLIATTMLVVGLFAVLTWDSTFPNRRDVFVLAPLPVRTRTMFLAKIGAVAAALALTVLALHAMGGIVWPLVLHSQGAAQSTPALTYVAALRPVDANGFEKVLNIDLAPAFLPGRGAFAPETGAGTVVGVLHHGVRRIFAYGTAQPDSIFEIGSISKTFTGLLLARMVAQEMATLDEPVRELLPRGTVDRPAGREITLLDLATHHSGLPSWPDNLKPADPENPLADYRVADLYAFLSKRGVARKPDVSFDYSNFGFSLLGEALANRARVAFPDLLKQQIAGPLGLRDTVIELSDEQAARLIQGHDMRHQPVHRWDMDAMAGAGGIRSTAGDMLTYLEAQLHPEKATGESLAAAISQTHKLRADLAESYWIALAWFYSVDNGTYWHNGATGAYSSYAFFHPKADYAAIVLVNQAAGLATLLGEHVRQRFAGEPAISLENVVIPARTGFYAFARFLVAYWFTMFAAGAFIFCFVLGLQGLTAQLLPRYWFLRVSALLQLAAFCGFVCGYMLQPMAVTPGAILSAQNHGLVYWSPSYWFLGLFQQLNGSPALAPLARRAWLGLTVCIALTATAYLLSYLRTIRKIVEEPNIVASSRTLHWLPRFGNHLATAVTQFSIRTLLRSRQHRMILAFYWGIAFASVIFISKSPGVQKQLGGGENMWHQPNVPMLVASGLVLCAAIVGIRVAVSIPLEPRSNWIFQVMPLKGGRQNLAALRRALYMLALAPVWFASAMLFLGLWPWRAAVSHLTVLWLLGIALTEVCLSGFHKIPFTCFYTPGRSQANIAVLGFLGLLFLILKAAEMERRALDDLASFLRMIVVLSILAGFARWRTSALANSWESELRFEDAPIPAIFALDLHRDGTPPA